MLFACTGLFAVSLGLLAQALVPLHEDSGVVTGKIRHLTKASTSLPACLGKNKIFCAKAIGFNNLHF
jgi:hypothetical protein